MQKKHKRFLILGEILINSELAATRAHWLCAHWCSRSLSSMRTSSSVSWHILSWAYPSRAHRRRVQWGKHSPRLHRCTRRLFFFYGTPQAAFGFLGAVCTCARPCELCGVMALAARKGEGDALQRLRNELTLSRRMLSCSSMLHLHTLHKCLVWRLERAGAQWRRGGLVVGYQRRVRLRPLQVGLAHFLFVDF